MKRSFPIIFAFLTSRAAFALVMEHVDLEQLAREADIVVHGTVSGMESRYDKGGRIVTDVSVKVIEFISGMCPHEDVIVTIPGGVVDGKGQLVPGAPRFNVGDEVVLFLGLPRDTPFGKRRYPVALTQGVFYVERGAAPRATQRLDGVKLLGGSESINMSLKDLIERTKAIKGSPVRP